MLSLSLFSRICASPHLNNSVCRHVHHHKERGMLRQYLGYKVRKRLGNEHKDGRMRQLRAQKVYRIDLSGFVTSLDANKKPTDYTEEEFRSVFKRMGGKVFRNWEEKGFYTSHSNSVIDPIVKKDATTKLLDTVKTVTVVSDKDRNAKKAIRDAYRKEGVEFDEDKLIEELKLVYANVFQAINDRNLDFLHDLVTEYMFPEVWEMLDKRTASCSIVRHLTQPSVLQYRHQKGDSVSTFAQISLRFKTVQQNAIYDRFGRLFEGSETKARDMNEVLVFERLLHESGSRWRLHNRQSMAINTRHYIQGSYLSPKKPALIGGDDDDKNKIVKHLQEKETSFSKAQNVKKPDMGIKTKWM